MKIMSQKDARRDFFKIVKEVNESNIPVIAAGKDAADDVVILAKADYDALMETLHLYGVKKPIAGSTSTDSRSKEVTPPWPVPTIGSSTVYVPF